MKQNEEIVKALNSFTVIVAGNEQMVYVGESKSPDISIPYEEICTPTQIGEMLSPKMSAIKVNKLLERHGFQYLDEKGEWKPFETAHRLVRMYPKFTRVSKEPEVWTMDYRIKWKREIVNILNDILAQEVVTCKEVS